MQQCTVCGWGYPAPVEYHHTEEECRANRESMLKRIKQNEARTESGYCRACAGTGEMTLEPTSCPVCGGTGRIP